MSTAILISGQMRTFAQIYLNQKWQVFRHFADPHFFITVQDNADVSSIDLLRKDYGEDNVHVRLLEDPVIVQPGEGTAVDQRTLTITDKIASAWALAPYANAAPAGQLLLQHWYQAQVWNDFKTFGLQHTALRFDTVIRIRPDLWFHSFEWPPRSLVRDCGTRRIAVLQPEPGDCFVPWWGRFGGINDRLAIMGLPAAQAYFTVFNRLDQLLDDGCPFHPESLVRASLELSDVRIHETLRSEFTTLRANGNHRPPEITPVDMAHLTLNR